MNVEKNSFWLVPHPYLKLSQSFVCGLIRSCWGVHVTWHSCCPPVLSTLPQGYEHLSNTGWSWGTIALVISVKRNPGHTQIPFSRCFYLSTLFKQNTKQNRFLSSACFSCSLLGSAPHTLHLSRPTELFVTPGHWALVPFLTEKCGLILGFWDGKGTGSPCHPRCCLGEQRREMEVLTWSISCGR